MHNDCDMISYYKLDNVVRTDYIIYTNTNTAITGTLK